MTKRRSTKRALLLSALSLLMCVSMLVGSTFAWFTDSVTSGKNIIASGNLDVELYHSNKTVTDENVDGATNLFKDVTLWEPGAVAYEKLTVKNVGSLALKYALTINATDMNGIKGADGVIHTLAEALQVAVVDASLLTSREAAIAAGNEAGWDTLGNWSKSGKLYSKEKATAEYPSEESCGVVIYWKPTANDNIFNVNNGKTTTDGKDLYIDLGVHLVATQLDAENDSFGTDYDKNAGIVVSTADKLKAAAQSVADGGIIILEAGETTLSSGPIQIDNKSVTIIGMGNATIKKGFGNSHIFNVANGAELTIENVTMDGNNQGKNGIFVRNNAQVTLKDVVIKNTGGSDIVVDEASDAAHGQQTTSVVKLYNSHVEDVSLTASPASTVPAATQDTYVLFNYYDGSTVGSIKIADVNIKPENIKVNGVAADAIGTTMYLNVKNDAELADALNTIKTNEAYWNKEVVVNLAAGTYSGDHKIPQYPEWNGVVGAGGSGNNMATLNGGENNTVITFVGETASTLSLRGAQTVPTVTFTGNVTVEGFGNAGTGFAKAAAFTTFKNIAFDAANSVEANGEDSIVMHLKAAANNVTFDGCVFQNATHIGLGTNRGSDSIGKVDFVNCTMEEGGCLSGYVETLNVKDCSFTSSKTGFIDKKKAGAVTVENCEVECAIYFLRTDNSGIDVTVTETTVEQFDVPNSKGTGLVVFRGSGHTATFTDCELTYDTLIGGAGKDLSTLTITNFEEKDGITYAKDGVTGESALYRVPADYENDTVTVAEGTTAIGNYAFAYNNNVKTVVLASTVTDLGRGFDSSKVEKVVLNEGLTTISSRAFKSTTALKEVVISSTVTEIADDAFQKTGLKTITIPATVERVGAQAFGASLIETVIFEGNTTIENKAFRGCSALRTVYMNGEDITFVNTTGQANCWFCNSESNNPGVSNITFYVKNDAVAAKVKTAMGAEAGNTKVYVVKAAVSSATDFKNAVNGGGTVQLTDKIAVEDLTYTFNGETTVVGGTLSRDTASGNPLLVNTTEKVTFEGVTFESVKGSAVLATRKEGANIEVNNCVFNNQGALSTGNTGVQVYANNVTMTFNNCTFNNMPIETNSSYPEGIKLVFNNCTFNWTGDNCPGMIKLANYVEADIDINDCKFVYNTNSQYTTRKNLISTYASVGTTTIDFNNFEVIGTRNNDNIWTLCGSGKNLTINATGELSYTFNGNAVDFNTYLK